MKINIPYYRSFMTIDVRDSRIKAVLAPKKHEKSLLTDKQIVLEALDNPIDSDKLCDIARGKSSILIITSDHTRPVPSHIIMPLLLEEVRKGSAKATVKILIATGFHRATTKEELTAKFGKQLCKSEEIIVHDAFDDSAVISKGILPSGGELKINKLIDWADLIVAEGFIEPHFFAGFSGGRKSILPGICSKDTIMYNHNARFIAHKNARTGVIENNPMHKDMVFAASRVGLDFILNVTIDEQKNITAAFAGHREAAHETGCKSLKEHACIKAARANLVVTSNGGYPLDQNIYQSVKSMTAAESCVNQNGVIIVIASCINGHGGESFYRWFKESSSAKEVIDRINSIMPADTLPDQWEAQILARVQQKCKAIIFVSSHVDPQLIADMHMQHASTFEQALKMADEILGRKEDMVIIPDGVAVIIEEQV